MNIYLIYKNGVAFPTTLPKVVQNEFKNSQGIDRVECWRNEKIVRTFKTLVEFNRFINPPRTEDDEEVAANNNEW